MERFVESRRRFLRGEGGPRPTLSPAGAGPVSGQSRAPRQRGGVAERHYVALGRGNSVIARSPGTEGVGADSDNLSDSMLAFAC
jgi:hypothetical protein